MKLADKPCYPFLRYSKEDHLGNVNYTVGGGLTFRERLIIALASNPKMIKQDERIVDRDADVITKELTIFPDESASAIILQADAIIKQLESAE